MAIQATPISAKLQLEYANKQNNCTYSGIRTDLTAASASSFMTGLGQLQNSSPENAYMVLEEELTESV